MEGDNLFKTFYFELFEVKVCVLLLFFERIDVWVNCYKSLNPELIRICHKIDFLEKVESENL